jgi:anti-anti-sigma factor
MVLAVQGEIDMATAPLLRAAIDQGLQLTGRVVLDFAGVTFMDSSGLNVLVSVRQGRAEDSLVIRNAPVGVVRVLAITGLDGVIRLEDDPLGI